MQEATRVVQEDTLPWQRVKMRLARNQTPVARSQTPSWQWLPARRREGLFLRVRRRLAGFELADLGFECCEACFDGGTPIVIRGGVGRGLGGVGSVRGEG